MKLEFRREMLINAEADRVWEINAGGFADIYKWSRNVKSSRPLLGPSVGDSPIAGRICEVAGFGEVHERLTRFDNKDRSFVLEVRKGLPFFVKGTTFETKITPEGKGQSCFKLHYTMEVNVFPGALLFPLLNHKVKNTVEQILHDLKHYSETGAPKE